jgi:hypothetical protein
MVLRKVTVVLKLYYQNAWAGRPKSCEICHLGHKRRIEKSAREASTGDQQIANALPFFPTGVLCQLWRLEGALRPNAQTGHVRLTD